jgi:hypothetical protein
MSNFKLCKDLAKVISLFMKELHTLVDKCNRRRGGLCCFVLFQLRKLRPREGAREAYDRLGRDK